MKDILNTSELTVITPRNDLESETIYNISMNRGYDTRVSRQGWGARLELEPSETFNKLEKTVLIVEIPGPEREEELRILGHDIKYIDHHCYGDLDRSDPKSSLEQFAEKVGYDLSREERLVAINDRDYIWGMINEGATYDEIIAIRENDFQFQGISKNDMNQAKLEYDKKQDFWHCTYVETSNSKLSSYIAELHQRPSSKEECEEVRKIIKEGKFKPSNIIIAVKVGNYIHEVNVFGEETFINKAWSLIQFIFKKEKSWKSSSGGFCGTKGPQKHETFHKKAELFVKRIRELIVERFTTFLLFPFTLDVNYTKRTFPVEGLKKLKWSVEDFDPQENWPELLYFHSFIRELLYELDKHEKSSEPLFTYWGTGVSANRSGKTGKQGQIEIEYDIEIKLNDQNDTKIIENGIYKLPITDLAIYQFKCPSGFNDIFILSMQIENPEQSNEPVMFTDLSRINEMARRLYVTFPEQLEMGKIPESLKLTIYDFSAEHTFKSENENYTKVKPEMDGSKPKIHGAISRIIQSFLIQYINQKYLKGLGNGNSIIQDVVPILDDRMLVSCYVAFKKPISEQDDLTKNLENYLPVFSRLMYVDPAGEDYYYVNTFIEPLMQQHIYTRWQHYGILFGFTRYSFICTGFTTGLPDDYFKVKVFKHFETMYFKMFLFVIFYRSWLICFTREIPSVSKERNKFDKRKNFQMLMEQFIRFSNAFWFPELSNQDQGIELFQHMTKAFELNQLYDEVEKEVQRTIEHLEIHYQENFNRKMEVLTVVAIVFAIFEVLYSYSGINPDNNFFGPCRWLGLSIWLVPISAIAIIVWYFFRYKKS